MPTLPHMLATRRSRPSRVFWPGLAGGLAVALALQIVFMAAAAVLTVEIPGRPVTHDGTSAMIGASLACLAGAATTGALTQLSFKRHVALNAYLAWFGASLILMASVALTTDAVA